MARLYNTFEFIGNISIPKDTNKFHEVKESPSGWVGHRLNFAVQESKTNSVFVELYGGYSKAKSYPVKTFGKGTENEKGAKLEIPWEDRLSPETIDMVADFKKIVVDFTTDQELKKEIGRMLYEVRNLEYQDNLSDADTVKLKELKEELKKKAVNRFEFIHNYDAIVLLADKLDEYKDYKFKITGSVDYSEHKGNFYRKFNPEHIEIVPNEEKSKLTSTMDIFFTKDSLDDKDFKEDKKVYINGYVLGYEGKAKKDQFFPQQFVINAQKIDLENENQVKLFEFLKSKFNVKGKGVYHLQWQVNVFRGADTVEFTIDNLTPTQRESVEFGLSKLEDYAPKGGMLGETVYENRLVKPILKAIDKENDFSEGAVESTFEAEDLEFEYTLVEDKQQIQSQEPVKEEVKEESKPALDDLDNLFG
ncbi:hypothetical protein [Cytobacillus praedii]|uniref:Uncharacterized protein n=1 Tax=Cytobacillus praedii TaxID=1742358 RepID=A0A4R1AMZ6_9BACI|nr:hypothetical protein [Cytobacillus praedii]TCJ01140.1 hypothetical protein E0Y62_25500 [Cytobacillus praedii]